MKIEKGDLVACYLTNTSEYETLMSWGVVLDTNPAVGDVLVIDNASHIRWWPSRRWRVLNRNKANSFKDLKVKTV